MKLTILSNEEQKEEAIRAIVTAQHETQAMVNGGLSRGTHTITDTSYRKDDACEWLSLCNLA